LSCLRFQFRLRSMLVATVVIAVLLWLLPILWYLVSLDWIDDEYAQWGAGKMVIHYLKDHKDHWPREWNDLKPYFDAGEGMAGGWSFAKYQSRVNIDWSIDVEDLEKRAIASFTPTFQVISVRGPMNSSMGGREPNEMVHRYLREKQAHP
jgi:hypothetical protein